VCVCGSVQMNSKFRADSEAGQQAAEKRRQRLAENERVERAVEQKEAAKLARLEARETESDGESDDEAAAPAAADNAAAPAESTAAASASASASASAAAAKPAGEDSDADDIAPRSRRTAGEGAGVAKRKSKPLAAVPTGPMTPEEAAKHAAAVFLESLYHVIAKRRAGRLRRLLTEAKERNFGQLDARRRRSICRPVLC
jgi:hypothetical protein